MYALDRFGRNSIEVAINKQRLKKNGKILISATQRTSVNIDGSQNLDGIILENVLIGLSEYYSAELSQKVRRGLNESRHKGNFTGSIPPYGYYVKDKKLYIDEKNAETVRFMFAQYASGKIVKEIIDELTNNGILYKGKPFKQCTVYKMLRLEKYIGIYRLRDEVFTNIYPQIVPPSLFEKVQQILFQNKIGSSSRNTDFILKGKLRCGCCGKNMNGESGTSKTGKINYYYKCSNRKKHKACNKESIKKDELEKIIVDTTVNLLSDKNTLSLLADEIFSIHELNKQEQTVLKNLTSERNKAQNSLENMLKAIEEGILTPSTKNRLNELEAHIEDLNGRILAEQCKAENQLTKNDVTNFISQALKENPRILIFTLIDHIVLYDDKIEIYYNYTDKSPDDPSPERRDFSLYDKYFITVTAQNFTVTFNFKN